MNYDNFNREVKRGVEKIISEEFCDGVVAIRNVTKNNNVRMKAISIVRKEEKTTPTIYLRNFYMQYKNGRQIESICQEIFCIYKKGIEDFKADLDIMNMSDFEKVRDYVFYKVINYDLNQQLLKQIPHYKFKDLAIVFYILVNDEYNSQATSIIHNQCMEEWKITTDRLRDIAFGNTWNRFPPVIRKIEDIIYDMIVNDIVDVEEGSEGLGSVKENTFYNDIEDEEVCGMIKEEIEKIKIDREMEMYVLTNTAKINGATCITYPGVIRQFAMEHESDIYIIPSSIHEVILIPRVDWSREEIDRLIKEVNEEQVDPVEILSDHVYIYRRDTGEIE